MVFAQVPQNSKSLANGLVTFAACFGMAATYYVLGTLIDRWDWPKAFLMCSAVTWVIAIVWLYATAGTGAPEGRTLAGPSHPTRSRRLRWPGDR